MHHSHVCLRRRDVSTFVLIPALILAVAGFDVETEHLFESNTLGQRE